MHSKIMDVLGDRVLELGPRPEGGVYRNFKLTRDADGIAWLLFDRKAAHRAGLGAQIHHLPGGTRANHRLVP